MRNDLSNKVIIIGAGLAGLAACNELRKQGIEDVIILEARHGAGGRIRTCDTFGLPMGIGANWIHGTEFNPVNELSTRLGLKKLVADPVQFITYDRHNNVVSADQIVEFNSKLAGFINQAKQFALSAENDVSLLEALNFVMRDQVLSETEEDLFQAHLLATESYVGANHETLSARHWDDGETFAGHNCFILDSYQPIVDELTQNCPIVFNTHVTEINIEESGVEIITNNGSYFAELALLTVPLGVLKREQILIHPPLPDFKLKAIAKLDMALFNIVAMKFPYGFWPKEAQALFFSQADDLAVPVFFNLYHYIDQPILIGHFGGKRALALEELEDNEIIAHTLNMFQQVFGDNIPQPEIFKISRWSEDAYTHGSYSYLPVDSSSQDLNELSTPFGRLFFAGEATSSNYPATTHGAYISGITQATNMINFLMSPKV